MNISFEKGVIKGLAEMFPDLKEHLMAIHDHFIDLMTPFRSHHLELPEMEGSASLKKVLPALIPDLDYANLEVQNGAIAYNTFKTLHTLPPEEQKKQRNALLAYCKLDTFAMVKVLKILEEAGRE